MTSDPEFDNERALGALLNHEFSDWSLLREALTHPSVSGDLNYQRLEFLGDRILGVIIAERLFQDFADIDEGDMALRYNDLVRKETLAGVAKALGLSPFVILSAGEDDSGGRTKPAILADICEAIIGALYLDGGLEKARAFILDHWQELVSSVAETEKDGKTRLQEWSQARGLSTPRYKELSREGPDHAPVFTIKASLTNGMSAIATGRSKRAAEQKAADAVLDLIGDDEA